MISAPGIAKLKSTRFDLEAQIGNTPLLRLHRVTRDLPPGVAVLAKGEHLNPGGSVKDRPALAIIRDAEQRGMLYSGKTILDATSGNTGIAYAMLGAARGYAVTLCLPANASEERKRILEIYGAAVVETDPLAGSDGAQSVARRLAESDPIKLFYADQYNNDANWRAHYETTGPEIWGQTEGRITHFVAGLGTCGTFTGVGRRLRELNPSIRLISMEPNSPIHGLEGLKHLPTSRMPGIFDAALADDSVEIATEAAQAMTRRLAREEGLFVGVSAGANVTAALALARELPPDSVVVTILCDGGERYTSERFWTESNG
ncbi:MAG TPA: cysteine synthase family protein [Pyrinomonadaceae bacterium]|jgi:cysteine synthase B|nr:cysteine synthase family protein [Pyrinomonadaceae bacterium]